MVADWPSEQWFKRHNPKSPEHGGAKKSRAAMPKEWLEQTRQAWEQTANRALEQAGRAERIDGRSLADRRDEAHREGDLERAAELSREPNVHRGPGADGRFNRALSVIHVESEQKRKDGDRPDRVEGLIESFLQSRARSLDIGR